MKELKLVFILFLVLGQIRFSDYVVKRGSLLEMHVNVVNEENKDADDVLLRVDVIGVDNLFLRRFDVDDNDNQGFLFDWTVPKSLKKGEYIVRVSASNDDYRDVEYREIRVV